MRRITILIAVLGVLAGMAPDALAKPPKTKSLRSFAAPGKKWSLALDLTGYKIEQDNLDSKAKKRYVLATNEGMGVTVSFWIEPMEEDWDSKACRKDAWAKELKGPGKKEDIKMWEEGDLAVVEYMVTEFGGLKLRQKNYHAYLTHDHAWIDIHISTMGATEADEARIKKLLKSVRIKKGTKEEKEPDDQPPGKTADPPRELLTANKYYQQGNYEQAARYYQKLFDAEKKSRTLNQPLWRLLVDQLGMCYGMTGKLAKAKEVFEYGIGEDPEYAMFHYNLACAYAEEGDLDRLLPSLEKAIKYRDNMIKGEKLPDPRKDSSFKKYLKNKRFQEVVKKFDK